MTTLNEYINKIIEKYELTEEDVILLKKKITDGLYGFEIDDMAYCIKNGM